MPAVDYRIGKVAERVVSEVSLINRDGGRVILGTSRVGDCHVTPIHRTEYDVEVIVMADPSSRAVFIARSR